jgi:hypothetical protein
MSWNAALLSACGSGFKMFGEAVRDIAILALVFIPLDYFKEGGGMSWNDINALLLWCFGIFLVGVASEWLSDTVKWAERIWEEDRVL